MHESSGHYKQNCVKVLLAGGRNRVYMVEFICCKHVDKEILLSSFNLEILLAVI